MPYSNIKTTGLVFDLAEAVGVSLDGSREITRSRLRSYAVETSLGYWLPDAYVAHVDRQVRSVVSQRWERLENIRLHLNSMKNEELYQKLQEHTTAALDLLKREKIDKKVRKDLRGAFDRFIDEKKRWFEMPDSIHLCSRVYEMEPMPEIWVDDRGIDDLYQIVLS